ncbi:Post-transcriptional regulator [Lentibacillus halodurans]|uniref:Post-transcriptional regulator n=1 Tax=Lentibacillus halodurans TaxID=237679 RepID=A0A1I0UYP6_9BACI|nr:post-transcriptional regulator [Lentibacillus halodurans]SFA69214.1 Post-transcriptional regulator [Lentibacillus halodurans]
MDITKNVYEWKAEIGPALKSKATELRLMGYNEATSEDVWNCLKEKVWKGNPSKRLYEVVQDIFHLSSNIYMSYLTVNAHQDEGLAASIAALTEND